MYFEQILLNFQNPHVSHHQMDKCVIGHAGPYFQGLGWVMVFNATFNNISVISWQSVLLVDETGVPRENHRPVTNH